MISLFLSPLLFVLAAGDSAKNSVPQVDEHYTLNTLSKGWDVELYLNGQPAGGGPDYRNFVTTCVIDGKNTGRIVARPSPGTPGRPPCLVQFGKLPLGAAWQRGEVLHALKDDDKPDQTISMEFQFTAHIPFRWLWQDAQNVGELTDADRQQIFALLHQLEELFQKRDWAGVKRLCIGSVAGADSGIVLDKKGSTCWDMFADMQGRIAKYTDYTVVTPKQGDIALVKGSKIVLLYPKRSEDKYLIVAGHAPGYKSVVGEVTWQLFFREMRFVRIGGQWHWIL